MRTRGKPHYKRYASGKTRKMTEAERREHHEWAKRRKKQTTIY